jgi:hypothetical protein
MPGVEVKVPFASEGSIQGVVGYKAKGVMTQVVNSLCEKKNWLKKRFKMYSNPKAIPCPQGCIVEEIYREGALKLIGATQDVTSVFFHRIFIITVRKI